MVPFVLVTGIWVEASCGRAKECPCCRGWGAPTALGSSRQFLIPKVCHPGVFGVLPKLIPLPSKWVLFFFPCAQDEVLHPFIPTTIRASSGPLMDVPSRRR